MPHEWDPSDSAADEAAIALATRIRAGEGVDTLLGAAMGRERHIVRLALELLAELDREALVEVTCEAPNRLSRLPTQCATG
jgi:hypothetical protein